MRRLIAFVASLFACSLVARTTSGVIRCTATDPSGAVIAGAAVRGREIMMKAASSAGRVGA
jgi:hypothetical protein